MPFVHKIGFGMHYAPDEVARSVVSAGWKIATPSEIEQWKANDVYHGEQSAPVIPDLEHHRAQTRVTQETKVGPTSIPIFEGESERTDTLSHEARSTAEASRVRPPEAKQETPAQRKAEDKSDKDAVKQSEKRIEETRQSNPHHESEHQSR